MNYKKHILYASLSLMLALTSCVKYIEEGPKVEEGRPARITFKLTKPGMNPATRGLLESEEQTIHRLYVYVFYEDGSLISKTKIPDVDMEHLIVDAYSGNNMEIYVFANYPLGETEAAMDEVSVFADLMAVRMEADMGDGDVLLTPDCIPMMGYAANVTVSPGNNSVPVQLNYSMAKITMRIEDLTATNAVTVVGWDVCDLAASSYLVEHGVVGGMGATEPLDAVDPENDNDFKSTDKRFLWEKTETIDENISSASETAIYIFENRRGGRRPDVVRPPEMTEEQYKGFRGKTLCAPERASYLKVYFEYVNAGDGNTYQTTMNVFLGRDNSSDYNVERGNEYIYTFRIHEGYDISVDLQVNSNLQAEVVPMLVIKSSAMIMDAHSDYRVLHMKASENAIRDVSVEIYDAMGNSYDMPGFDARWLKLSRLNIARYQISQSTPEGQIWQQPYGGQEGYFARARYIPHKSYRNKLAASSAGYSPPPGIILGDDNSEYPDNDDCLPYEKTARRMCYKITDIPFEASDPDHEFVIYADEYEYSSGASARHAYVVIKYTDLTDIDPTTGQPKRKHFEGRVIQRQPLYLGLVASSYRGDEFTTGNIETTEGLHSLISYRTMAIERIEESSLQLNPSGDPSLQSTDIAQWGFVNEPAPLYDGKNRFLNYSNGYFLTANAVYEDITIDTEGNVSWDGSGTNQRPKWGSRAYKNKNTAIPEGPSGIYSNNGSRGNSGPPFYYPNSLDQNAADNEMYHPVFNSSAARYCHEKNRDLNGDGIISPEETFWYLPSLTELQHVWINYESIQTSSTEYGVGFYWSSTEISGSRARALGFTSGYAQPDGYLKSAPSTAEDRNLRNGAIRCVRKYDDSEYRSITIENGKPYFCFDHLPGPTTTTEPKGTGTGQLGNNTDDGPVYISENAATIFSKFRVAVHDVKGTLTWPAAVGYSASYSGAFPADNRLGYPAGRHTNVNPAHTLMRNAPADTDTGCNAYYEEQDGSDKGTWRLPNKRELMMMWIMRPQLENIKGFTPFMDDEYWSASERRGAMAHTISFSTGASVNPSKTETRYVRCIREDLSVTTFTLIFHGNGGTGCPANERVYAKTTITLPAQIPVHPDGYTFAGWTTDRSGGGTVYPARGSFPMPVNDVTLYAQWRK